MTASNREQNIRDLVDQIARDTWTLHHVPAAELDVKFYTERIAQYQAEVKRLREVA